MRDDGDPFGGERGKPARVIEMGMRVDEVSDRLVRDDASGFSDDGETASLALPTFEYDDVIAELDCHSGIITRDPIHTVRELF